MVLKIGLIADTPEAFRFTELLTISIPERLSGATLVGTYLPRKDGMRRRYSKSFPKVELVENSEDLMSRAEAIIFSRRMEGPLFKDTLNYVSKFVKEGLPILMERPIAGTLGEAEKVIRIAEARNVPIIASSCLLFTVDIANLKKKVAGLGPVKGGNAVGPGELRSFGIHVLEPLLYVMGGRVESVYTLRGKGKSISLLQMEEGKVATIQLHEGGITFFQTTVYCVDGWDEVAMPLEQLTSGLDGYRLQLTSFIKAAQSKEVSVPYPKVLETLRTLIALNESALKDREVSLKGLGRESSI